VRSKVRISVTDEGIGIPAAIKDRVFDPFFTTKEAGEGTGLGLSLVFSIVEDLGGDIDIISPVDHERGTGTRVILRFPCYDESSEHTTDEG
jgi:signal transduction histidine kinase